MPLAAFVSLLLLACATGLGVLAARLVAARRRAARRAERWAAFAATRPAPPPSVPGPTYPITPGLSPAGSVSIQPGGLEIALPSVRAEALWVPWPLVQAVLPADEGAGVDVHLAGGRSLTVSALAGRALWEAQAQSVGRRVPQAATAS